MGGQGRRGRYVVFLVLALSLSACFRSPAPEPLAPLAGSSGLVLENLDGVPFNDRLVFSRISGGVTTHKVHDLVTLRLRNTSAASIKVNSLTISDTTEFVLPNNETSLTVAAGAFYDLQVRFVESSGSRGVRLQTLTLDTNDPVQPSQTVQLAGAFMTRPEGDYEVSLQQIADAFGYKINTGQPLLHNDAELRGDEVRSNFWKRADPAKAVYVRQLAAFHGCCSAEDTIQITGAGGGSFKHAGAYGQSLLPLKAGSSGPAEMTVNPTGTFEVKVAGYSSNVNNTSNNGFLSVRFWPVKDRSGAPVPGSYFAVQDFVQNGCGSGSANCDYNDNVYLVTNIAPVTPTSYRLNVGGPAYTDKAGNLYAADTGLFRPSSAPAEPAAGPSTRAIADTEDDTLYQTYRAFLPNTAQDNRKLSYNLSVPPGVYDLRLHFAELYWDAPGKRVFDVIVEDKTLLDNFDILAQTSKFSALVKTFPNISVNGGTLTVTLKAEADYGAVSAIEVVPSGTANLPSPRVTGTAPASGATNVFRNTAVAVDVELPNLGAGVDETTLNTATVKLFKTSGGASVPGTVNTTGGNDAIVYQPSVLLEPGTGYTFQVTSGVKDQAGAAFTPYTMSFTTGTQTSVKMDPNVNFTKTSVFSGSAISTLVIGPDGKLYGAGLDGVVHRWQIDGNGQLKGEQTFRGLAGKAVVGVAFNPNDTKEMYLWTTANEPLYPQPAPDFSGKLYKLRLRGINFVDSDLQLYITGLPRSAKDHLSNSLAFGPDGLLYMNQGGNTAMGAPDSAWYNRPERLLSAAVLQIDPRRTTGLPINVQTEPCDEHCQGTGTSGNYNPYAADAPVKIYASGVRNAYDLVWHSNGKLYVPTNGSAAGGNTPDNPATPQNEALFNVATQDDYLFKVEPGGYYGHPNPKRREYVMNGGNPTASADPAEVVATGVYAGYPVGTQPESKYRGFTYNFGRNRSPNGVLEYKSNAFGGKLKGKLLVVEYSAGDDILALPLSADGNVLKAEVTQVIAGLSDPLDLIEDTRNGNLYLAELIGGGTSGKISLLRPSVGGSNNPPAVSAGVDQSVAFPAAANLDGTVSDDGLPSNTLTTLWKKVIGPGTVTFGNAAAVDTTASFSAAGTYVLELSASDGALSNSARVTVAVQTAATTQAVTGLVLINADTDQVIRPLVSGDTLDYQALGTSNLSIRADTSPATVGSVSFTLDGKPYRTESQAPYAIEGDVYKSNPPDYLPISPVLALGGHTLQATPYSEGAAAGTAGTSLTVSFTVSQGATANKPPTANFSSSCSNLTCTFTDTSTDADGSVTAWNWNFGDGSTSTVRNASHSFSAPGVYTVVLSVTDDGGATATVSKNVTVTAPASGQAVVSFTLINADTDREVGPLSEGMVVDYQALGTSNISVRANTNPATVGSVSFTLDGSPYRIENHAPYSLAGEVWRSGPTSEYDPVTPPLGVGSHTLQATPNTEKYGGGSAGAALTVNFTVRQGTAANKPPTAGFNASCSNLSCTFTDASADADGSVTAWNWNFGDNSTSTSRSPAHAYSAAGTYPVTLTVTDNGGATAAVTKNVTVTATAPSGPAVTRLVLVNADTDQVIRPLVSGDTLDYQALGTSNLNIRADTSPATVGSVSFVLDGKPYRIESYAPYTSAGDGGNSIGTDYYPMSPALALGGHTLTATAYTDRSAGGTAGAALTVSFTVTQGTSANKAPTAGFNTSCSNLSCTFTDTSTDADGSVTAWRWNFGDGATSSSRNPSHSYAAAGTYTVSLSVTDDDGATGTVSKSVTVTAAAPGQAVTSFSLINADTDQVIRPLADGDTVDYQALGTSNISVRANTNPATVGSVSFTLDGSPYRIENHAPYSLAGEVWRSGPTSEYDPITPPLAAGSHTVQATPNTEKYGGGSAGTPLTVRFTVKQGTAPATLRWDTAASSPLGLTEAQGAVVGGKLYVFGGYTSFSPVTITPKVKVYDAASDTWGSLPDAPTALTHAGVAVDGDTVYVAGGYVGKAGGGQVFGTKNVWKYAPATSAWTPLPPLPAARGGGQLVKLGGDLHFFGGSDLNRTDRAEHWQLALNGGTAWTSAAPLPVAVNHHGAAVLDGKIYSIGGQKGQDSSAVAQASVYVWNPSSGAWTAAKSLPKARSHVMMSSFVVNGRLLVAGGDSVPNRAVSDVTVYDPTTATWTSLTPLPAARMAGVGVPVGNDILFTTGSGQKTTYKSVTD